MILHEDILSKVGNPHTELVSTNHFFNLSEQATFSGIEFIVGERGIAWELKHGGEGIISMAVSGSPKRW